MIEIQGVVTVLCRANSFPVLHSFLLFSSSLRPIQNGIVKCVKPFNQSPVCENTFRDTPNAVPQQNQDDCAFKSVVSITSAFDKLMHQVVRKLLNIFGQTKYICGNFGSIGVILVAANLT